MCGGNQALSAPKTCLLQFMRNLVNTCYVAGPVRDSGGPRTSHTAFPPKVHILAEKAASHTTNKWVVKQQFLPCCDNGAGGLGPEWGHTGGEVLRKSNLFPDEVGMQGEETSIHSRQRGQAMWINNHLMSPGDWKVEKEPVWEGPWKPC